jgi:tryptophan-rich sensory protein
MEGTSEALRRNAFWGYALVIIVTLILAAILGNQPNSRPRPPYGLPRNYDRLVWFVALILLALGVYYGTLCANLATGALINLFFILQLIFFLAWTLVYDRFDDLNASFWAGVVVFLLGLATLFFLWQAGAIQASILVLIYLVWVGYEVFVIWDCLRKGGQRLL